LSVFLFDPLSPHMVSIRVLNTDNYTNSALWYFFREIAKMNDLLLLLFLIGIGAALIVAPSAIPAIIIAVGLVFVFMNS
jgi:4-amino-4-deoxy-L-arabinose transferase-like glycosyltransferase